MSGPFHFLSRIAPGQPLNSAGDKAGEPDSGNGHRIHRLQRSSPLPPQGDLIRSPFVWPSLNESVPNRRLTHWGEALLAIALLMAGLSVYLGTWVVSHRMTSRGEFCLRLPLTPVLAHQGGEFVRENQLLMQHELGKKLIRELPAASEGQRLRMKEQLNSLVREIDSTCELNIFYYSQELALLTLATSSATLMIICLVLLAPEGLQNISRGIRTVMFTAGVILGVSVNFLQLGQLSQNGARAQQIYRGQYALLQRFNSSLANQHIEEGIRRSSIPSKLLSTPQAVAQLITAIDTRRLSMGDPRMELDGSLAEQTWSHLLKGDGEPAPGNGQEAKDPQPRPAP